jgi:hypothetical protein
MGDSFIVRKGGGGIDATFSNTAAVPGNLAFVGNSNAYGTAEVYSRIDNDFIYAIGDVESRTIKKWHKGNLAFVGASSVAYPQEPRAIEVDDNFVYVGGIGNLSNGGIVSKYHKGNLVFVGNSPSSGFYFYSLASDNDFVYASGMNPSFTDGVGLKYHKGNLALAGNTSLIGVGTFSVAVDNDFLYIGTRAPVRVRKYHKGNLAFILESPTILGSGQIREMHTDDNFIYVAASTGSGSSVMSKRHKSNLVSVGSISNSANQIETLAIDNDFLYVAFILSPLDVRKHHKGNLAFIGNTNSTQYAIRSVNVDKDFIYVSGGGGDGGIIRKWQNGTPEINRIIFENDTYVKQ